MKQPLNRHHSPLIPWGADGPPFRAPHLGGGGGWNVGSHNTHGSVGLAWRFILFLPNCRNGVWWCNNGLRAHGHCCQRFRAMAGAPISDPAFLAAIGRNAPGRRPALQWQCPDAPKMSG